MSDDDKPLPAQDQFVQNWLVVAKSDFPESEVLVSIAAATKSSLLDEAKLAKELLAQSRLPKKGSNDPA
jgi:hypothetical protein